MSISRLSLKLAVSFALCLSLSSCGFFCSSQSRVSIGKFDSKENGARAAVRRLAEEIHRCPEAKDYRISWNFPSGPEERGWLAVKYVRQDNASGVVGYEYDPDSGMRQDTYLVDNDAIDR